MKLLRCKIKNGKEPTKKTVAHTRPLSYKGEDKECGAVHPQSHFGCTRKEGHKGNHIACGCTSHNLAVWKQTP